MIFDPVFSLEQMVQGGANKLSVYQTGQLWARHFPDRWNELSAIMNAYQYTDPPVAAKMENGQVDQGLVFTPDMFQKKNLVANAKPVKRKDNPFFSGEYKDPIPDVVVPTVKFNTIEEAFNHYRVNKPKDLIKAMKGQGIKIFTGASNEQILELLNTKVQDDITSNEE